MSPSDASPKQGALWIVWAGMLAVLILYAAFPLLVAPVPEHDPRFEQAMLLALFAVALASAIGTLIARHLTIVQPVRSGELDLSSPAGLSRFFAVSIALWAIAESIGIYGLVLYFLFAKPAYLHAFLLAAAILLAVHSPRAPAP